MRNQLRETIRQEVRDEVRHEIQPDGQRAPEADTVFRVVLRPIASSLPLGFFAFTVGTVLLTALELIGAGRFALTGVYQATGNTPVEHVAGWMGVPLGAFALYGGLALLLEEGTQRMVLPIGRRGRSRTSPEDSFAHRVHQAELEPGVRRQL
jgi:uncharacterized protein